jgi:hypothetical protein
MKQNKTKEEPMCELLSNKLLKEDKFVIFTAWKSDRHHYRNQSLMNAASIMLQERKIPFARVKGCYQGWQEPAFMTEYNPNNLPLICDIARLMQQESIFIKDHPDRFGGGMEECYLYYMDHYKSESLGVWCELPMDIAMEGDAWTQVGDRYFTTVKVEEI